MNSIIFYSFIFAAFIVVLHADLRSERISLKEMMTDVKRLIKLHKNAVTEFHTPESEVDNLSCYMAELEQQQNCTSRAPFTSGGCPNVLEYKKIRTITILIGKANNLNLLNIDCPNRKNYKKKSPKEFLNQMLEKLKMKYLAASRAI